MKQLVFCEYCREEHEYNISEIEKITTIKDEEFNYKSKKAFCNKCRNEIFIQSICDYNLKTLYKEYRIKHNIINPSEIEKIMVKYSINQRTLDLLLGWNEGTLARYLDGDMATNNHSDILNKIYENPQYYSIILQTNKERIDPKEYNKSRQAVRKELNEHKTEEKINSVIKYILIRCEDITPLSIQKLLYYVQGFYYMFTENYIFEEDCEALVNGPVYRSIYNRYKSFGSEFVNEDILSSKIPELSDMERNITESVIKFLGCYSGKVLEEMTKNETPWILIKSKLIKNKYDSEVIEKNLIAQYFLDIKEDYNIINILDIQIYSKKLFESIFMH